MVKFYESVYNELNVYIRHSAWLKAVPDTKDNKLSRKDAFEADEIEATMPFCLAMYIVEYLYEIGIGNTDNPLSHAEIAAWMANTGIELTSWEVRVIHRLSRDYLDQSVKSIKQDEPSPWEDAPYCLSPNAIAERNFKKAIEEMAKL